MSYLAIIGLIVLGYFIYKKSTENFTQNDSNSLKELLATDIKNFLTTNTTYEDYTKFVNGKNNRFYVLIEPESFYEMKALLKLNQLSKEAIKSYMERYP